MSAPINRRMITVSIMLATVMQTLDGTIANVALPHMQGSMSASQDQIAWVLTAYIVAAAIATPLTGWLCDRFGQKNIFVASVAGFTLASALCGVSTSLAEIVGARLLQGVFGAALVPLSQVVLMEINPREKQGQAMAIWGVGVMVGPILGPTLGGWLTDSYDWRWVFFINIPIGVIALYGIWRYIPEGPGHATHAVRHVRLCFVESCDRRAANVLGPRRTERLVRIDRDLDRGDHHRRLPRPISLCIRHAHGRGEVVFRLPPAAQRQLHHGPRFHLHHGPRSVRYAGVDCRRCWKICSAIRSQRPAS
jgi:multidrug resistance protein